MLVRLYANLRDAAGSRSVRIPMEEGRPISWVVAELMRRVPALKPLMLDEMGELGTHIAVVVNGRDMRHLQGTATIVRDEDRVDIFPPVGGGAAITRDVSVRFAGDLHARAGAGKHRVIFRGRTLRDLMARLLAEFDISDLIRDGDTVRPSVQVIIDGRLAYTVGGWEATVEDGATICIFSFGGVRLPVDLPEGTRMREIADKAPGA